MAHPSHDFDCEGICKGCGILRSSPPDCRGLTDPCPRPPSTGQSSKLPKSRWPLDHPDHPIHRAQRALDELILSTPTGPIREALTVTNIHFQEAKQLCSQ